MGTLLAGYRADRVLSQQAGTFLANGQVPVEKIAVVLHLGDLVDLLKDRLLRDLQDLDFAGLVVVDRASNGEFDVGSARAAATFTGLKLAHLCYDVLVGRLVVKAERLRGAVGLAPGLEKFQWFV